jgi:hypothetical protein
MLTFISLPMQLERHFSCRQAPNACKNDETPQRGTDAETFFQDAHLRTLTRLRRNTAAPDAGAALAHRPRERIALTF